MIGEQHTARADSAPAMPPRKKTIFERRLDAEYEARVKSGEARELKMREKEFRGWGGVKNSQDFIEQRPMYWAPRKWDIDQMVADAIFAYNEQLKNKTKKPASPLRIVDVGGGNGSLVALVVEGIKSAGYECEAVIIDVDQEIVDASKTLYPELPEIKFVNQTAEDFAVANNQEEPLHSLLLKRKQLAEKYNPMLDDLRGLIDEVNFRIYKGKQKLSREELQDIWQTMRDHFGISIPFVEPTDKEGLLSAFDLYGINDESQPSFFGMYRQKIGFDKIEAQINKLTKQIEAGLACEPPQFDLVLNSWMSYDVDYTKDIRALNGAIVVYAEGRSGITGLDNYYSRLLGEEPSYNEGSLYTHDQKWNNFSTDNVADYKRRGVDHQSNRINIQRRKDLPSLPVVGANKSSEEYPWEIDFPKE